MVSIVIGLLQRATYDEPFFFFFFVPPSSLYPKLSSPELLFFFLVSIYDRHADIQRREFEDARWACFDYRHWRVSTCYELFRLA